jgi:acetyl esterase
VPLDPQIEALLGAMAATDPLLLSAGTPESAREGFIAMSVGMRQPQDVVPVKEAEDRTVAGPAGDIPVRVYRPEGAGPVPTVVYFHGGGWVVGAIETHDNECRRICRDAGAVVVSVDYRLAPDAPWPAAVEDCLAATRWAAANVEALGGDAARLAVGGDSAGGNLAAIVTQQCRDAGGPALCAQLLIYPAVDFTTDYPSRTENGTGYFLTLDDMEWFQGHYAPDAASHADPRLSPLRGELTGLPPAVVAVAEYDPLRDEGLAYAAALRAAGVPVTERTYAGLIHGFFSMGTLSDGANTATADLIAAFRDLLAAPAA